MLTAQCNKKRGNYYYVMLRRNTTRKTFRVNRLVLEAFNPVENMEELQVGHLDENPMNNNLDNLY